MLVLGQCVSEMVAAHLFNEREGREQQIYGAITTGSIWKFLSLLGREVVNIDLSEYHLRDLPKVLGILTSFVS